MRKIFLAAVFAALSSVLSTNIYAVSTTVVINEVYGGAGCGTAGCSAYQNDFIELRNISLTPQNISGWSVQYTSAGGNSWQVTTIPSVTVLQPGDRYLIAQSQGGPGTGVNTLPPPNLSGSIAMSATAAKVALTSDSVPLTGTCPSSTALIDFVGYGATANCNGSGTNSSPTNAPAPSTTTSISRNSSGTDTDVDSSNFTAGSPTPQSALQPTAASVSVSGRVATPEGRGVPSVSVSLSGGSLTGPLFSITSSFGYYQFEGLNAGEAYVVTVNSKRYTFTAPSRIVTANDSVTDVDFVTEP